MNYKDYTGERFGRLVAIERVVKVTKSNRKRTFYRCECDCGETTEVRSDILTSGKTISCGCYKRELLQEGANVTSEDRGTRLHNIYHGMLGRCYTPSSSGYKNYGGRGITVCPEWMNSFQEFKKWALSNGYRDDLTIDRRDNDGNYEPGNCRWVDYKTQARNRRPRSKNNNTNGESN